MSVFENNQSNVTLFAFDGDNAILNTGNSVLINGSMGGGYPSGNNYIENHGTNVSMLLGGGADTVANSGNSTSINLGDGQNSVGNIGNQVHITAGNGFDTVVNQGSSVTISTGAGNDSIDNRGTNAFIDSGANNDTVGNFASNVKVNLGAGEDVFINYVVVQVDSNMNFISTLVDADKVTINGEDGGDVVENYGSEAVISGGAGGDVIYNYGISVIDANGNFLGTSPTDRGYLLDGGDSNDYIYNENYKATISGGAHKDTIINTGNEVVINGDSDADSISNYGNFVTIYGGTGTDTIILDSDSSNNRIIYNPGDGNDLVIGFNQTSTLQIGNGTGTYSSQKSGDDVIVMTGAGGEGRITLQGAASLSTVNIEGVYFDPLIIIGSDGDDNVAHWGQGVSIEAGTGNDYIYFNGNNISVNGGKDKDTIVGNGNYATIEGGDDDDEIYHSGSFSTITGGKGKDLISLNSAAINNLIRYALNDDNDLIYGFNETSTLQITNGQIDSIFSNGFDDFLIVGDYAIKLVSTAWIRKLNVVDSDGKTINLGTVAINGTDDNDSIIAAASGRVIKPGAGNDYIFNQGNYVTVISGNGNKTIELEGDNNLVNLGNGIHIVSLGGSGSTVTPDDSNDDNSNTLIQGGIVYIDESGIDHNKLQNKVQQSGEETLKNVKEIIRNDPIIEDILKNKANSEYLDGLSLEEANEAVEYIRSTLDSDTILKNLKENGTAQDYRNFLTQKGEYLKRTTKGTLEHINDVSNINTLLDRFAKPPVTLKGIGTSLLLDVINCAVNYGSWIDGWGDFMKKHPDAYKEAWEEVGGFHAKDIIHPLELLDKVKDFNSIVRSYDRDAYDTNVLNGINSLVSTASLAISLITATVGLAAISGTVAVGAVPLALVGVGASVVIGVVGAVTKTDYLMKVRPGERNYADVFASQFFGYGLGGTFENASYRDAPQIIYQTRTQAMIVPSVNYNTVPLLNSTVPIRSVSSNNVVVSYNVTEATSVNIALLTGGAGNDSFSNEIENTSINACAGNDTIMNSAANVTINVGADDDLVRNTGNNVKITADSGNNNIENSGANVTITTGTGNDVVKNSEVQRVTISTGGGDDYVENFGNWTSVVAGEGADYILSFGEYNTLDAGSGSDTIHNFSNNTTVKTGDGNNLVENIADYVELTTSNGNNTINNGGYFVKIETGSGKDVIENIEGKNVSILSGGGDDYIENLGNLNSVVAGDGNDYVFSSGDLNTIIAGKGNDIIDLEGDTNTKICHSSGDGNDTIYGFNETSTLQIGAGNDTYLVENIDDNIIVATGDEKITLKDAAILKVINISGIEIVNKPEWSISDNMASYGINSNYYFTLYGLNPNVKLSDLSFNKDTNVITLSRGALGQETIQLLVPLESPYKLALGDDVVKSSITPANWSVNGNTANYKAAATSAGYYLSYNDQTIEYTNASGGNTLVTVTGLKSNAPVSGISLNGSVVTLSNSVLNQGTVTVSNGYTLKLANDVPKTSTTSAAWSVSGTTATYKANATSAGYSLSSDGKTINYNSAGGGNTIVTVSGLKSNAPVSGISLNGNVVTLSNSVLNEGTVSVSNGYTLKLADDVPKSSITNANWSVSGTTATYKANSTSAGYSLSSDGKTINYTNASGGNTLVTVSGLKSNAPVSGISLNGNVVTLSNSVLDQGTVSVSNGYTLQLADDVPKSSITNANWSVSGTTATYKANATSAGYSLSSDAKTINYTNASGGNTLVTVSGLKSNAPVSGISLNGNVVTLSNSVLNQGAVSVSNGYTLKLADDVAKSSITNANWSVSGTTATYKASATSAGYSLSSDGKTINYTNASGGNTLVTVSGLKSNAPVSGISLNGNTVTLSNSVLNQGTVSVSKGYTLKLADDVPKSSITNANWSVSGTTATYKASATSAGYSLSSDGKSITYTNASGGNTLVTISGLKNGVLANNGIIEGIRIENNIVKVSSKITDGEVKITGNGYTLEIVEEIQIPKEFSIKNNVLTVSNKFTGNEINLNEKWASNITKVNVSALSQNVNIIGNGLANSITGGKGADTIDGGEGNDSLTGGAGKDVYIYESGNDVITDYKSGEDKIQMNPNAITSSTLKGSDVILTTDQGTLTIKGVKDKVVTFVDDKGQITEKIFYADMSYSPLVTGLAYDAKRTALTSSNKYTDSTIDLSEYLETVAKVNASALSQDMNITGNGLANSITGGKGADTINGGSGKDTISGGNGDDKLYGGNDNDVLKGDAGNDSLFGGEGNDILTGGAGKDIFVYEGGNDVITDYKSNEDKIQMNPNAITNSTLKGSDVILTTDQGTLTIKGIKDKTVTFVDENGTTTEKIFYANMSYSPLETGLTYDAKRTALTSSNKYTDSTIDLSEHLETVSKVNALAVLQDMNITGNSLANSITGGKGADTINGDSGKDTIFGGNGDDKLYGELDNDILKGDAGNDSLYGGNGNDTLTGGAGKDIFIYESGNDIITDYKSNEDKIQMNPNAITSSTLKGSDAILTTDQGTLTIKGIKDKVVTFVDENGTTTEKIFYANMSYSPLETGLTYDAKKTALTASNKYTNSTIDLSEYLKTIAKANASALSQDMNITGNNLANSIKSGAGSDIIFGGDLNDTIYAGSGADKIYGDAGNDKLYGDAGNDTLFGGFGNDTLTGGNGSDVFVYEGGNDVITDYAAGDSIKISSGKISKTSYSGKNLVFTIGDSNLTVKNAKGKQITVTDSNGNTTTQIYSGTQTYSKTFELLYDCNFMTDEFQIDDISEVTADDYSIGQIQSISDSDIFDKATLVSDSSFDKK